MNSKPINLERIRNCGPVLLEALVLLHRVALQTPLINNPDAREVIDKAWAAIQLATKGVA